METALRYSREAKSSCRPSSRATHALVMICSRRRLVPFSLSITIYPLTTLLLLLLLLYNNNKTTKKSYFFPVSHVTPSPPLTVQCVCNKKIKTPELVVYTIPPPPPTQTFLIRRSILVFNSINLPIPSESYPFIICTEQLRRRRLRVIPH